MKKGFTLIELLAVIVILAIIALIVTPIILGTIDRANKNALKDSAYGLISAGKLYIAEQRLEGNKVTKDIVFTFPTDKIDVDGSVPDGTKLQINSNGEVAISMSNGKYCATKKYDDTSITLKEGPCVMLYKPQYYYLDTDFSGRKVGKTAAPENPSTTPPIGRKAYLGYDVADGVMSVVYTCFIRNNTEYCLKATGGAYDTNIEIIKEAFSDVAETDACYFGYIDILNAYNFNCDFDGFSVEAEESGYVSASVRYSDDVYEGCLVNSSAYFSCG